MNTCFNSKQVSKVIWYKAASPSCHPHSCEFIRPLLIAIKCIVPRTHMSHLPNGISIGSAILHSCAQHTETKTDKKTDTQTTLYATSVVIDLVLRPKNYM